MSTRATYRFSKSNDWSPATTIYVHFDGYPQGASVYFYEMLTKPSKGCMATQFIRAVEHAEITGSHDAHGDTQFRYDVEGSGPDATLTAKNRRWSDNTDPAWQVIYVGSLRSFIDQNHEMIEGYSPFVLVKMPYGSSKWLNLTTAELRLNGERGPLYHLRVWEQHGSVNRESANWKGQVDEVRSLVTAFPSLMTDEIAGFIGAVAAN